MNGHMPHSPLTLTSAARHAMDRLAADLTRVLGPRLVSVVAYSPTRAAAFADRLTADDLQGLAPLVDRWHQEGLETPLLMTPEEFRRSLDAFPLEYEAMLNRHVVIAGTPPFADVHPSEADLRRACEVQAQSFLIHLRQGWLQAADHHEEQETMLIQSAAPLRALLVNVARLHNVRVEDDAALVAFGEQHVGLPAETLRAILALELHPEQSVVLLSAPEFMNAYLLAAETLWAFVDKWRS
jgi:hypothetical protein